MTNQIFKDWGEASEPFDNIMTYLNDKNILEANEAQTRFDVIDRIIREVLSWQYGQISVEEVNKSENVGFVDYILRSGDYTIVIEAKKVGATFPSPTRRSKLKLSGSVLGEGEIGEAIKQAENYARTKNADIVIVTNGLCWCFYSLVDKEDDSYANLLFPFSKTEDPKQLFDFFAVNQVENGSLSLLTNRLTHIEDRLLSIVNNADGRIDRNNIADHITPALNNALYADA